MQDYIKQLEEQNHLLQRKLENTIELNGNQQRNYIISVYHHVTDGDDKYLRTLYFQIPYDNNKRISFVRIKQILQLNLFIQSLSIHLCRGSRSCFVMRFENRVTKYTLYTSKKGTNTKNLNIADAIEEYLESKKKYE
jgi:hypothetical protein